MFGSSQFGTTAASYGLPQILSKHLLSVTPATISDAVSMAKYWAIIVHAIRYNIKNKWKMMKNKKCLLIPFWLKQALKTFYNKNEELPSLLFDR